MHAASTHPPLTIIEPKLRGPSGHYAEFVRAIAARADGVFSEVRVVADPRARDFLATLGGSVPVVAAPPAGGTLSELAAIGASLRAGTRTLVLTANASHAFAADWLSFAGGDALSRLSFFVHWPLSKPQARLALALAVRTRRHALFVAPTRGVRDMLESAGCARVAQVAYPATRTANTPLRAPFRHLLMAGAARINKGLDLVAELAGRYAREGRDTPLLVQVSPKHVDHHGSREDAVVARLLAADYRGLVADPKAPDRDEYAARFVGSLVLAPYERAKFADGVSGIVLDALLHGAPCVATAGTWAGDVVERFDAGIAIRERTPERLAEAIDAILARWDHYAARASEASDALAAEHDPRHVAQLLASGGA
ncbi:MAG: hypothetical protein ACK5C3_05730 [bacterium]